MVYTPETGHINDAAWRAQSVGAFGGDYLVDPVPSVAVGSSSTSIESTLSAGAAVLNDSPVSVSQQTVTHPDGPAPGGGPNGEDEARVDLVTIGTDGTAGRMVGTPMVPRDADGTLSDFRFPNVAQPVPPTPQPSDNVVVVAAVWVPAGVSSSEEMFDDWIIPREIVGAGLNDRELLPGRDLQYRLDTASEGDILRGDPGQQITLSQPLTVNTPGITIDGLNLRYADGAATNNSEDMLSLAAAGVSVRNITLDGNKANQSAAPDGITATHEADRSTIEHVNAVDVAGYAVNVSGGGGTVVDVGLRNINSQHSGNGAVVIQNSANRTSAEKITSRNPDSGGAVLVRNGPIGTALDTIFTTQGDYGLRLADFGAGNSDSAPIENTRVDGLTIDETPQACDASVSDIGHSQLRLSDVRGRDWAATTEPAVDLDNINAVTITNSVFNGYQGTQAIAANQANTLHITGVTISQPPADSIAIIADAVTNFTVANNTINGGGDLEAGIDLLARGDPIDRGKCTGNNIYNVDTAPAIRLREDGYTIQNTIVKNNAGGAIENGATGNNVIVKDNIP